MYTSRVYPITRILKYFTLQACHFHQIAQKVNKVSLYLQRAKLIDSIRLCLRSNAPETDFVTLLNTPSLDSFVVANALRAAPSPSSALSLVETLKKIPHFSHTKYTLYALAKILAKSGQTGKLRKLIGAINERQFKKVPRVSFMDCMRWYAAAGDLCEVKVVWGEWMGVLCKHPCVESYNIVMKLYVDKGMDEEAVKLFHGLVEGGALPNYRTCTIVIEHLINCQNLDSALEVFQILPDMRIKRALKLYSVLVEAFINVEKLDVVKTLLNEMRADGILPGRAMRLSLEKMREAGYVDETEGLINEMLPDERIKSISYSIADNEDDVDDVDVSEEPDCVHDDRIEEVRLKPWLDPAALASALKDWELEEVASLEQAKFVWTSRLACKLMRSFRSPETSWLFFCWVAHQPGYIHDIYTISRMITKLARGGHVQLVDQLLFKIKHEGMRLSFSTVRLIIDYYGFSRKGNAALNIFQNVKTICGPLLKNSMLILYSSLLRSLAKCQMNDEALDILDEMILLGVCPDLQTFSGLMHHYALQGDIKTVQRLLGLLKQSALEPDAFMYKILMCAYCKCERASLAFRIFEDMRNSGLVPDAKTKEFLVKSLWKEGKFREVAKVEEMSEGIEENMPLALPGHLYTVSSADLMKVCRIYSSSFSTPSCNTSTDKNLGDPVCSSMSSSSI